MVACKSIISYEKSWILEKARLATLAMETPMYGEIAIITLYTDLLKVIRLASAAVPRLPMMEALTAPT